MSRPALWPCLFWGKLFDSIFAHLLRCVFLGLFCYVSQCDCVHIKCTHSLKRAPLFARIPALLSLRSASNLPSCQRTSVTSAYCHIFFSFLLLPHLCLPGFQFLFWQGNRQFKDWAVSEEWGAHKNPDETDTDTKVSASLSPSFNNYLAVPRFSQETQHVVL